MPTIKEIAKACNVSIATVSNILNNKGKVGEETRKAVLAKVEEMDYVPNVAAKNLKQRTTKSIGIITEDLTVFNAPEIVDGIDECLEKKGYNFLLSNLRYYKKYKRNFCYQEEFISNLNNEFSVMRANQVEGIIYVSSHSRDLSEILTQEGTAPLVVVYGFAKEKDIPSVVFHDEDAAYKIVSELLKNGGEKVGIIAGEKNSLHTSERLLGCQRAMYQKGILYNPELVYYGDWSRGFGYQAIEKLLEQGVKTVFSMNDSMAAGIYDYANENNLSIGKDILVGGIGSEISNILRPKLTTIEMPLFEMGHKAGEIILDILEGREKYSCQTYPIKGRIWNNINGSI